jgi:hypothetical protein
MLALVAVFNHLFVALQKTLPFRAERPHFASKLHPPSHRKATLWGTVVSIPFRRCRPSSFIPHPSSLILRRYRPSSAVLHPSSLTCALWVSLIPSFHVGVWGVFSLAPIGNPAGTLSQNKLYVAKSARLDTLHTNKRLQIR